MQEEITVERILQEKKIPAVGIDHRGIFFFSNHAFEEAYGWSQQDLLGELITKIMPPHMRDAHNFGFSRFLTTETPRILSTPLNLPTLCKDGSIVQAEHIIVAEKHEEAWRFAATITPTHGSKTS